MSIEITTVKTKADRKEFVNFQFEIYKNYEYWVPPIKKDEVTLITPDENPAMENTESEFWLAKRDGKVVGRIGAIISHPYNEKIGKNMVRFSRVEFIDDFEVSKILFNTVENWAKERNAEAIHGPLGFTNLDNQGMLIDGFDWLPSIASVYHAPYYKKHIDKYNYEKEIDWVEFRLKLDEEIPAKALKLKSLILKRYKLQIHGFTKKEEMLKYAPSVFNLLNASFEELPYVVPFSEKMIDFYVDKYFKVLHPEFVKVITQDDEVVAFILGMPSLSKAMQKAKGKLFPFGFSYILKALKKPKEMDLLLTGIKPELQGKGVSALLITELQQVLIKYGIREVETTGIFETNQKAIQHWKHYDHVQHKVRRCFVKNL